MPSAGEFLHEFVGHYVALENKLLKTLTLLLFRPGRLTRDYLDGKRARYVLPLRLYLTLSLIFFAVFKWEAHGFADHMAEPNQPVQQQAVQQKDLDQVKADLHEAGKQAGGAVAAAGEKALDKIKRKAEEKKEKHEGSVSFVEVDGQELNWIGRHFGPGIQAKAKHFSELPSDQQWRELTASASAYAPYAIFAMMPMFALYLKLLYLGSGRRYGEHLLFALHTNAFAFLVLILMMLVPTWIPYAHAAMWLWLVFYLPTAMRKVYGGSRIATLVRWMVAMLLHLIGMFSAIVSAFMMAVVH
nr:DUF3667 domain-containing protein [Massilia terrae]